MPNDEAGLITTSPSGELTIQQLAGNMDKLREVMKSVMKDGSDFGSIPGTNSKPTLLKPGGEKLAMMFRFAPEYHEDVTQLPDGHREYQVKCRLIHIPSQAFVGEASAVCSTMESKYRYRGGAIACPTCGKPSVIKGKAQYGGGWLCWQKKGGCGAKFPEAQFNDGMLTKIENPDLPDSYNTVKQIAQKRAFISAIKTATATSELFTQDVEDGVVPGVEVEHRDHESNMEAAREAIRQGEEAARRTYEKPKPEESREWLQLKEELKAVGCGEGRQDQAAMVLKYLTEGRWTLKDVYSNPTAAKEATDNIDTARKLMHMSNGDIAVAAGLKVTEPIAG